MLDNEADRFAKARQALFTRFALAVGAGNFSAIGNVERAVLFDDRRELVAHVSILAPAVAHDASSDRAPRLPAGGSPLQSS